MGQEVKNPLRAQSKYGLMESSAKIGKTIFRGSPEHFLDKNAIWDRTPPHLHINCSLHVWGRAHLFNYLDLFKSYGIFGDFVVPMWSSLSLCRPHIVLTSLPSSPSSSCCPHSPQKVPMWSPWSQNVVLVIPTSSMSSPSSPHCLEGPHIIPNPLDTHSNHPPPPGGWGPRISKNAIRFELIKIFYFCLKI